MTLRRKTAILLGGTLFGLIAALSLTFQVFFLDRFRKLQEQDALDSAMRAVGALSDETSRLTSLTEDYATWDEPYEFMRTRDERFTKTGLPTMVQTAVPVHVVALLDVSGHIVFGRTFDPKDAASSPLSPDACRRLSDPRLLPNAERKGVDGVLLLDDVPMLVATRPILRSDRSGPPRGTFLLGSYMDSRQLEELSRYAHAALKAHRFDDPHLPADVRWARGMLSQQARTLARAGGADVTTSFALVDDVFGEPALVFSVESPRRIQKEGRASIAYLIGALAIVGLGFGGVALYLIEALVLSRLGRLSAGVGRIAAHADFSARVSIPGHDELSRLAADVNGMLSALEASRQSLEDSQAKLRDIVENSTNLFYSRTPDHTLGYVSPQTRPFLDCEPGEALREWTAFISDHPANAGGMAAMQRAIDTGERQPVYELELIGRKGRRVWVEVNEAPVVRDGRTVAVVGALTDVTAQKRAASDQARLEEQLRQSQKMEAIGRLAGGVAHDFNNLLSVIIGYAELLLRGVSADPQRKRIEQILKASERAASLTRQLLAFGRKQVVQPRVLDLNGVVTEMEPMLRRLIGEQIELRVRLDSDLGRIRADAGQVEQVLMNLAVNARDAMPRHGRLTIETVNLDQAAAQEAGLGSGPLVLLAVSDSGNGMDSETLSHIFEPFFTTKDKGKGTGLGLATVYGIVQQSQGSIRVSSQPGKGTAFKVYFPCVAPASETRAQHRAPATKPAEGRETILLVEDEDIVRALARETLAGCGYHVLEAAGPDEARAISGAYAERIQLLLTDVVMPRMSGPDLAALLVEQRPEMQVIYASGYTDDALGDHCNLGEEVNFLQKPFAPAALSIKVREVLDRAA